MRVTIDREGCIGCGVCEALCPEVFRLIDDGKSSIVEKYRGANPGKGEVDGSPKECVKLAEESCPVQVIHSE